MSRRLDQERQQRQQPERMSGWHSGKLIKDGRGFENLPKQLKCSNH